VFATVLCNMCNILAYIDSLHMGKGDFSRQALIEIIQICAMLENIVGPASALQTVTEKAVNMTKKICYSN